MQSFLPYPSFRLSACVLDSRRLGKQRSECIVMLRSLASMHPSPAWRNHPATQMWEGHEPALCQYMHCIIEEWEARGYHNSVLSPRTTAGADLYELPRRWAVAPVEESSMPPWLGHARLHAGHRAALLMKDPGWYAQFGWDEVPVVDYFWPGRMPALGEYLVREGEDPRVVTGRTASGDFETTDRSGSRMVVSRRDVYLRTWTRALRG